MSETLVWVIIEVVIIYLILVVIVALVVNTTYDEPQVEKTVEESDINTGDILGVGYRHPFAWFVTAWSSSVWTHTGVAWRDPDTKQLYVMEAAIYDKPYQGTFRIPFQLWLKINKRSRLCHLKYTGPKLDERRMSEVFKPMEAIKLSGFNWTWYRFLMRRPYVEEKLDRHYVCYEITIMLLQRMGIVQKTYMCSSYFARDVIWRHLEYEPGYGYEDPVSLVVPQIPN